MPAPFLSSAIIDQLDGMVDDASTSLALCALLTVAILEGLTLRKFRLNVYVCFMFTWGLVLWIDLYEKSFKVCL